MDEITSINIIRRSSDFGHFHQIQIGSICVAVIQEFSDFVKIETPKNINLAKVW